MTDGPPVILACIGVGHINDSMCAQIPPSVRPMTHTHHRLHHDSHCVLSPSGLDGTRAFHQDTIPLTGAPRGVLDTTAGSRSRRREQAAHARAPDASQLSVFRVR